MKKVIAIALATAGAFLIGRKIVTGTTCDKPIVQCTIGSQKHKKFPRSIASGQHHRKEDYSIVG